MPQPIPTTVDRFGLNATLENLCLGGHCFLVCGGPSIHKVVPDLRMLSERGIATFGFNNVTANTVRTLYWTYGDSTKKFHDSIFCDPGITKFIPAPKLDNPIRTKREDGTFADKGLKPRNVPGVIGIYRNSDLKPAEYLTEDTINWGVGAESLCNKLRPWMEEHLELPALPALKLSHRQINWNRVKIELESGRLPRTVYDELCPLPKVLSTMFQAVRLVYYLGFRVCYLVGADFRMSDESRYSFDEEGNPGTVRGNNGAYPKINKIFHALRPEFDRAGFRVFNCYAESQLTAFDWISFDDAYAWAREHMPKVIDTRGWYEKD